MENTVQSGTPQSHTADLRRRIYNIERLSAMPTIVWQIMKALGDEQTSASNLEKIIEVDPALASKLLSLANSAYYSRGQKITTIGRAIVVIGFLEMQILALGAGLADMFDMTKAPPGFDGEDLWLHCFAVSFLARELAEASGFPNPGEVMIAGLLHDLGKLVLVSHFSEEFFQIIDLESQGEPYYKAETHFNLSHTVIGYLLAKNWHLPEIPTSAIRYHHVLQTQDPNLISTCLVTLADIFAKKMEIGLVQDSRPSRQDLVMQAAGLTKKQLDSTIASAKEKLPQMQGAWRQMLTGEING